MQADSENTRMIHEAYQFLTAKKKKKSGRSMVQVGIHNSIFIIIYVYYYLLYLLPTLL